MHMVNFRICVKDIRLKAVLDRKLGQVRHRPKV
jgi:hypothetical protein